MNDTFRQTYWVTPGCLGAIHTALEAELLYIFETAQNAAYHAGRVTLMQVSYRDSEAYRYRMLTPATEGHEVRREDTGWPQGDLYEILGLLWGWVRLAT